MTTKRRRKGQRKEVRIINNEWVDNNCTNVTERDMGMLKLLAKFPILNSEHLRILTPRTDDHKAFYELSQGTKRCNERIRILYDLHCVNKWTPRLPIGHGTSKQYVALDRAGIKLLNLERRARNEIPQDWKHQSLIMDVYCQHVEAERNKKWENRYLEREEKQVSSFLIPDLVSVLKRDNKGAAFFIEVDRSEKKESMEKDKLKTYYEWYLSKSWVQERWAVVLPKPIFPTVVYLFDEEKKGWKRRSTILHQTAYHIGLKAEFMGLSEWEHYIETKLKART